MKYFIEKAGSHIYGNIIACSLHSGLVVCVCVRVCVLRVGCSLTGAGGGGFLAAIVKSPSDRHRVEEILRNSPVRPRAIQFMKDLYY